MVGIAPVLKRETVALISCLISSV